MHMLQSSSPSYILMASIDECVRAMDERREEIMDILQNIGQNYVDDSTNTNEEYSRNYIRHRILPEMEHVNQKAAAHISELGMQMKELLAYDTPQME